MAAYTGREYITTVSSSQAPNRRLERGFAPLQLLAGRSMEDETHGRIISLHNPPQSSLGSKRISQLLLVRACPSTLAALTETCNLPTMLLHPMTRRIYCQPTHSTFGLLHLEHHLQCATEGPWDVELRTRTESQEKKVLICCSILQPRLLQPIPPQELACSRLPHHLPRTWPYPRL